MLENFIFDGDGVKPRLGSQDSTGAAELVYC